MKITDTFLWKYSLPFNDPVWLGGQEFLIREGFLLGIELNCQKVYFGEVSPLASVHRESLSVVEDELKEVLKGIRGLSLKLDNLSLSNLWGLLDYQCSSSVAWGLEQALLSVAKNLLIEGINLSDKDSTLNISGLIQLTNSESAWTRAIKDEITSYKVKIGREPIEVEVKKLQRLMELLPSGCKIRFDGNRHLNCNMLIQVLSAVSIDRIEYIEEPFRNGEEYKDFLSCYPGIKIALDEGLWELDLDSELPFYADVLILKPTRLGGLVNTVKWIHKAMSLNRGVVLSSCYDTGLSMITYRMLVEIFQLKMAMGLGTYSFLRRDIFDKKIDLFDNKLSHEDLPSFSDESTLRKTV